MEKRMTLQVGKTLIDLKEGDITQENVDAIVNAANSSLLGGGGVDGAIHRAAGRELLEECREIGGCPTGEARLTKGYRLPARYIIHTVGPIYRSPAASAPLLWNAHWNSLTLARENSIKTIAFPAISTGVYGYPLTEASKIALKAVFDYLLNPRQSFELIRFVLFTPNSLDVFAQTLAQVAKQKGF